jgi:hypothetical protein
MSNGKQNVPEFSGKSIAKATPTVEPIVFAEGTSAAQVKSAPSKVVAPNTLQQPEASKGLADGKYETPDRRFQVVKLVDVLLDGRKATLWRIEDTAHNADEPGQNNWARVSHAPTWTACREVLERRYRALGKWDAAFDKKGSK